MNKKIPQEKLVKLVGKMNLSHEMSGLLPEGNDNLERTISRILKEYKKDPKRS